MKKRWNRDNNIDLTSMLDVIFIFLMLSVCLQTSSNSNFQSKYDNNVQELESIKQELESVKEYNQELEDNIEAVKKLNEDHSDHISDAFDLSVWITLAVDYTPTDIKKRTIRIRLNEGPEEEIKIEDDSSDEFEQLEEKLEGIIKQNSGKPVLLRIDTSNILYRDEQRLDVLTSHLKKYGNVYREEI